METFGQKLRRINKMFENIYKDESGDMVGSCNTKSIDINKVENNFSEPQIIQNLDTSDLEIKLIGRLANGEISADVFSIAILGLKKRNEIEDLQGYM